MFEISDEEYQQMRINHNKSEIELLLKRVKVLEQKVRDLEKNKEEA